MIRLSVIFASIAATTLLHGEELPESPVFELGNVQAVSSGPTISTVFTLGRSWRITKLTTYHWNGGSGAPPGTIALAEAGGVTYGPWSTIGRSGQGGAPNVYWDAAPNAVLPPGTYTVVDSSPTTWSYNAASGGRGFVSVSGKAVVSLPAAAPTVAAIRYSVDGDPHTSWQMWTAPTPAGSVQTILTIPAASMGPGIHRLVFAAAGADLADSGVWITTSLRRLPKSGGAIAVLAAAVGSEPSAGAGVSRIIAPPSHAVDSTLTLPAGSVGPGPRRLFVRARDAAGDWGPLCIVPILGAAPDPLAGTGRVASFSLRVVNAAGQLQAGSANSIVTPALPFDGPVTWPALRLRSSGSYRLLVAPFTESGFPGPWAEVSFTHEVPAFTAMMNQNFWPPENYPGLNLTFGGDTNRDTVANGLAFAFGLTSEDNALRRLPVATRTATGILLTFRQRHGGTGNPGVGYQIDGLRYMTETSIAPCGPWTEATGSATLTGPPIDNLDGTDTVSLLIPAPPGAPKFFARLRISQVP